LDNKLQIIITSGSDDAQRAVLGFATAVSAAISNTKVYVFLAMHGASWANENTGNEVIVPGFSSISEYIEILQENDVSIEVCSTCVDNMCMMSAGGNKLRKGVKLAGIMTMTFRINECATVTF
jgi:predicted peroxiredoxin